MLAITRSKDKSRVYIFNGEDVIVIAAKTSSNIQVKLAIAASKKYRIVRGENLTAEDKRLVEAAGYDVG